MANYSFFLSDGVTTITVTDSTVNNDYTVPLLGQSVTGYGDDVAIGAMRHLENFAAPDSPENNLNINSGASSVLKGQLWFDSSTSTMKVNIGTTTTPVWQALAGTDVGTQTSSLLRWDGSNWTEETQARVTSGGTFQLFNTGFGSYVTQQVVGTAFTFGTSNVDTVVFDNIGQYLQVADGAEFRVSGGVGNSQAIEFVPGDVASVGYIRNVGNSRVRFGGSISRFDIEGALGLEERASAPADVATFGQVWVSSADNGLYYTNESGTDTRLDVTGGGTLTGSGSNNQIATWSGTSSLDGSSNLTFDGTNFQFNSAGFGDFVIDRVSASGGAAIAYQNNDGVKGYAGFDDAANFTVYNAGAGASGFTVSGVGVIGANALYLGDVNPIVFGTGNDALIQFDGTNLEIDASGGASDIVVSGANLNLEFGSNLEFWNDTGATERITFRTDNATAGGQIGWRDSGDALECALFYYAGLLVVGGVGGNATSPINIIMGSSQDGEVNVGSQVTLTNSEGNAIGTKSTIGAHSSRGYVHDKSGAQRNIGYNETPTIYIGPGTTDLDESNASRFFHRYSAAANGDRVCRLQNNISIPIGTTWIVTNWQETGDTGTLTITEDTGVTLYWLDGGGAADAPTGTRTLATQGVCTIRKHTSTEFVIWGAGLS